jgi:integrase
LEDVRRYRLHLASSGAGTPTINGTVATLRFFFNVTLDRADLAKHLSFVHEPRKLPVVLSPEEVVRFLEAAPSIKYKAALSVAYGAGLRVSEVVSLKISDVDSKRMMLRVEQGKGRKDRHAMLSPALSSARLVSHCAAAGLAIPRPGPDQPPDHAAAHPRLPCRGTYGRDHQVRDAAYLAPQLRHPSAGTEERYQSDSSPARSRQA